MGSHQGLKTDSHRGFKVNSRMQGLEDGQPLGLEDGQPPGLEDRQPHGLEDTTVSRNMACFSLAHVFVIWSSHDEGPIHHDCALHLCAALDIASCQRSWNT